MTIQTTSERILLVEDDHAFRQTLKEVLLAEGYAVMTSANAAEGLETLQSETIDLVITDLVMPGMKGEMLLSRVRSAFPEVPVIAITAYGSLSAAVELTRAGAADYLTKPFSTGALFASVARVLEESSPRREQARAAREHGAHLQGVVGRSEPMVRLFDRIGRLARSPAPVLITGETGTGKELFARAVHRMSDRNRFVPVNCSAIPEHLLESELYGHSQGAFTGATRDKPGLFEAADGGTLFLDEVGELPLAHQPKLLRALESREIWRIGEVQARRVDVRVIVATHRDLGVEVETGAFREDLYWRLNVLHLAVPALRERPDDIPLLAADFLTRFGEREAEEPRRLSPAASRALMQAPWPGNVRQLFNVLERSALFATGPEIGREDLPPEIQHAGRTLEIARSAADRELTLWELEREFVLEVLRRTENNKTRAAKILDIPRRTLYRRLEEYGIMPGPEDE